jgi:multidrug efflux pump subunit AcrA (membrane-fusion protein)
MGGAVQITLEQASKGLAVPVEALFEKEGKLHVYRLASGGYEEVPVKVVQRNEMTAAVDGALTRGDKIARERPPADLIAGARERHR